MILLVLIVYYYNTTILDTIYNMHNYINSFCSDGEEKYIK